MVLGWIGKDEGTAGDEMEVLGCGKGKRGRDWGCLWGLVISVIRMIKMKTIS